MLAENALNELGISPWLVRPSENDLGKCEFDPGTGAEFGPARFASELDLGKYDLAYFLRTKGSKVENFENTCPDFSNNH